MIGGDNTGSNSNGNSNSKVTGVPGPLGHKLWGEMHPWQFGSVIW